MKVTFFKLCIAAISFLILQESFAEPSPWLYSSEYIRKNYRQLRDLERYLFSFNQKNARSSDVRTDNVDLGTHSFLIVKDGVIIYEKYSRGHHKDRPQKLWSMSKSIVNLLIGIAIKENKISLEDNLCKYLKDHEYRFDCNKITVKNLLGWSSGMHWQEKFDSSSNTSILNSSVFNLMYSKQGYKDSTSFILNHPLIGEPGDIWHYSSGDTNLLMHVLSKVYPAKEYSLLPWNKLFNELGIQNAFWDTDHKGVFNGCCSLYLTTRDLALIGEFLLKKGQWMGKQFLPKDWVKNYVQSTAPAFLKKPILINQQVVSGFHWWLNTYSQHGQVIKPRILPSAPDDLYFAKGYSGQFLFVIPSMQMVIVRTGNSENNYLDVNAMMGMALSVVTGRSYHQPIRKKPLPFVIGKEYESPKKYEFSTLRSLNNLIAKEMCSCLFIERGTDNYCRSFLKSFIKFFQGIYVSKTNKMVRVSTANLPPYSRAVFKNQYGCQLL